MTENETDLNSQLVYQGFAEFKCTEFTTRGVKGRAKVRVGVAPQTGVQGVGGAPCRQLQLGPTL